MEHKVYRPPISANLAQLRHRITAAVQEVTPDMCRECGKKLTSVTECGFPCKAEIHMSNMVAGINVKACSDFSLQGRLVYFLDAITEKFR
ncbi:hypothetical protein C0J52_14394 [Blattella germanica]|nr:hypothetical protein C0J52_14394 [Blattella germanica]